MVVCSCVCDKRMEKGFDLLNLQRVVDGTTFDNLTSFIMKSLMEFGGLSETNLANKLVSFGVDKIIIFQGVKNGFINYAKTCPIL